MVVDVFVFIGELDVAGGKKELSTVSELDVSGRLVPAARATDPQRRAWQEDLLDCERLRREYQTASDVWRQAQRAVEEGERPARFADLKLQAAQQIARELNERQNTLPQRIRDLCSDPKLRLQWDRLKTAIQRTQARCNAADSDLQSEKLRWDRHKRRLSQLGDEGQAWQRVDEETEGLRFFSVALIGAAASDATLRVLCREWNAGAGEIKECAALVLLEHADATAERSQVLDDFENNRHNRTWSVL